MDSNTHGTSPAVLYAWIFGAVLTLVGVLGFFLTTSQDNVESLLGFDVNLFHNIVHLSTGVLGLIAGFMAVMYARLYAIVLGVVYTLLGVWGLAAGGVIDPFGLFGQINMADHFLHLAIGLLGIGAYVASRSRGTDVDRRTV